MEFLAHGCWQRSVRKRDNSGYQTSPFSQQSPLAAALRWESLLQKAPKLSCHSCWAPNSLRAQSLISQRGQRITCAGVIPGKQFSPHSLEPEQRSLCAAWNQHRV